LTVKNKGSIIIVLLQQGEPVKHKVSYTIGKRGSSGCAGFPVVGATGVVHGCHKTEASARAQQSAIYASVAEQTKKNYDGCCPEDDPFAKAQGPCWDGYEQVGFKTKNGRKVPNCVPKTKAKKSADGPDYQIHENHPGCDGVALMEVNGTSVLCYANLADAKAALAEMNAAPDTSGMQPDMSKVWKGSGFDRNQ
jgi:hypothetical protein